MRDEIAGEHGHVGHREVEHLAGRNRRHLQRTAVIDHRVVAAADRPQYVGVEGSRPAIGLRISLERGDHAGGERLLIDYEHIGGAVCSRRPLNQRVADGNRDALHSLQGGQRAVGVVRKGPVEVRHGARRHGGRTGTCDHLLRRRHTERRSTFRCLLAFGCADTSVALPFEGNLGRRRLRGCGRRRLLRLRQLAGRIVIGDHWHIETRRCGCAARVRGILRHRRRDNAHQHGQHEDEREDFAHCMFLFESMPSWTGQGRRTAENPATCILHCRKCAASLLPAE